MSGFSRNSRFATTALVVALSGASVAAIPPVAASASTFASSTSAAAPSRDHRAFELIFNVEKVVNTQPAQIKNGDSWVTYFSLSDGRKKKVGDGSARCSAVQASPQGVIAQCTRVLRTRAGQITLLGMDGWAGNPPWTSSAALTGGTDRYSSITGSARISVAGQHEIIKIDARR
ncbi:hypothetical protein [Sphaerisporangium corydalis]|uniref:Uncharacterized protein n=1 Tax=Sphaerisporangium corydalis TaxID=1441875 RepID=A0ABV9EEA8_9ACTN|nr:hypothetical protein [Sphaerisporangium corydalis]